MILDTNAISHIAAGNAGILVQLRSSRVHSLPTVVSGEFRYGILRSRYRTELNVWLGRLEAEMEILEIKQSTAQYYAKLRNELRELGRPIPENDLWIAALSREHGLAVLSRDAHFDFVPGLVRVHW